MITRHPEYLPYQPQLFAIEYFFVILKRRVDKKDFNLSNLFLSPIHSIINFRPRLLSLITQNIRQIEAYTTNINYY